MIQKKTKKTLVIDAHLIHQIFSTYPSSDSNLLKVLGDRFEDLIKQGFTLYYANGHEFLKLNTLARPDWSIHTSQETPFSNAMSQYAIEQLELSQEEVFAFNEQELNLLIEGDESDWNQKDRWKTFFEANLANSNLNMTSLGSLFEQRRYLRKLDLSGCINLERGSLPPTLQLPYLQQLVLGPANGRVPSINKESIINLLKASERLEQLDLSGVEVDEEVLKAIPHPEKLKTLRLDQAKLDESALKAFLNTAQSIEKLDFARYKGSFNAVCDVLNASVLQELILGESDIDSASLAKILTKATNLKKLDLRMGKDLELAATGSIHLPYLETLHLTYTPMDEGLLAKILRSAPLKSLTLTDYKGDETTLLSAHLDNLAHFSLKNAAIDPRQLAKVLAKTPKLKSLSLTSCKNFAGHLPDTFTLNHLEQLSLSLSTINTAQLGQLLHKTPHLKKLDLSYCKNINESLTDSLVLNELEELDLSYSAINAVTLGKILVHAKKLKKINLEGCFLTDELKLDLQLPELEEIKLDQANIHPSVLAKIFAQADALKKLDLSFNSDPELQIKSAMYLPSLERLSLGENPLNPTLVNQILTATKMLREINIDDCDKLSGTTFDNISLPKLEKVFAIGGSTLFQDSMVAQLLTKAPNLKKLTIMWQPSTKESLSLFLAPLNELDKLYVDRASFSLGLTFALTPALKELHVNDAQLMDQEFTTCPMNYLESCNLFHSTLTEFSLHNLLSNAPRLKHLHLESLTLDDGYLLETDALKYHLPLLETVDLTGANIGVERLFELLSQAPRLKQVILPNLRKLTEQEIKTLTLKSLKTYCKRGLDPTKDVPLSQLRIHNKLSIQKQSL